MRSWLAVSFMSALLPVALLAVRPQAARALTASQVYEQVKGSVVVVKAYDRKGKQVGLGSGVMLQSGDIITNYHVAKAGVRYTAGRGAKAIPATLKAGDPDKDLCLLTAVKMNLPGFRRQYPAYDDLSDQQLADKLYKKYYFDMDRGEFDAKFLGTKPALGLMALIATPARLGKAARLKVGEPVYAVGAPQGLELSLSEGIVSQLRGGPPPIIQTTAAISPGSSGGGLFNAEGELVGITTFYLKDGQSLNFALPVEWIGVVAGRKIRERPIVEAPGASVPEVGSQVDWEGRALALEKAQDWPGLLAHCRRWTQAEPRNAAAWLFLGDAYGSLGRYREAVAAYREALRLMPNVAAAWILLGDAYEHLGRYREVIEACREALRLKPDLAEAWYLLGGAYGNLGHHQEAVAAYQEALRLKPDDADTWHGLGVAYALSGNRNAALEAVKELRRYDPQKAEKLLNLIMKP